MAKLKEVAKRGKYAMKTYTYNNESEQRAHEKEMICKGWGVNDISESKLFTQFIK